MLDDRMRVYKDQILGPLAALFGRVSPNVITLAAMLVGLAAAGFAAQRLFVLALILWLASRILDGMDGIVARSHGRQSDFGGYLDILADFVVYAALPIGLFLGAGPTLALAVSLALMLASFYVNGASWMYLAAILEKRNQGASARGEPTTVTMPSAVIGGTETILFYSACLIWPAALGWLFPLMAALVAIGVLQRVVWAYRNLA